MAEKEKIIEKHRMTIKEYAVKHRLSIFNVVKMVKSGELKSETVSEEGKETLYILLDKEKEKEKEIREKIVSPTESMGETVLKRDVERLTREVRALRAELEALKRELK